MNQIHLADNLSVLRTIPNASIDLIYIDPPFNTGKTQARTSIKTVRSETGNRIGFGARRYATVRGSTHGYQDEFDDYLGFLEPRL